MSGSLCTSLSRSRRMLLSAQFVQPFSESSLPNSSETTRSVSTIPEFGKCTTVKHMVYVSLLAVSCFADKTLNLHINASKSLRCYFSIRAWPADSCHSYDLRCTTVSSPWLRSETAAYWSSLAILAILHPVTYQVCVRAQFVKSLNSAQYRLSGCFSANSQSEQIWGNRLWSAFCLSGHS